MKVFKEKSLNSRYFYKLFSNLFALIVSIVTTILVTRALGPDKYGNFEFINSFFRELIPFFTFTSSIGFFTKFAQRKNEFKLIVFFRYLLIFGMSLLSLFVFISFFLGISEFIWKDQTNYGITMGLIFCILIVFTTFVSQISDAIGITISLEVVKIVQKFIGLFILIFLYANGFLSFYNFYLYNILIQLLLFILIVFILNRIDVSIIDKWYISKEELRKYTSEFYEYSQPLFLYAILGGFVGIFDRWILQLYGGSEQQGFFSLGNRIGTICFLFTSSLSTLITREFSIAHYQNNLTKMAKLFRRYVPLLYSIASFFSCYVLINSESIILITSGKQYSGAIIPLMLLSLYPIHQTYGQLNGAVFYSMNKTRTYTNIGIFFMIIGTITTFFLLSPKSSYGLNYGSIGLAIKVLLMQLVHVNVQLYYNSKYLKLNFFKYMLHQIAVIIVFLLISSFAKFLVNLFIDPNASLLVELFFIGVIYLAFTVLSIIVFPKTFGLLGDDLSRIKILIKSTLK